MWQYGHTDVAAGAPGYLDKPDGMDFLPAGATVHAAVVAPPVRRLPAGPRAQTSGSIDNARRIASVSDFPTSCGRASGGRVLVLGGLVAGSLVIADPRRHAGRLARIGSLPSPTHDAAAVLPERRAATLFGGGESVSSPAVVRVDPSTRMVRRLSPLDEPLSDLGAAVVRGRTYLVGGLHGSPLRERSPPRRRRATERTSLRVFRPDSVRGGCGSRGSDLRRGRRHRVRSLRRRVPSRCALRTSLASSDTPSADRPCAAGRRVGCALADRW